MGAFLVYKASKLTVQLDTSFYTKEQLLLALEDMRMDYTPYYIHYYHLLCALRQEYSSKPNLVESVTTKIQQRLQEKLKAVHEEVRKKYLLESDQMLHTWIT